MQKLNTERSSIMVQSCLRGLWIYVFGHLTLTMPIYTSTNHV